MRYDKFSTPIFRRLGEKASFQTVTQTAYELGIEIKFHKHNAVEAIWDERSVSISELTNTVQKRKYMKIDEFTEFLNGIMEERGLIKEKEQEI